MNLRTPYAALQSGERNDRASGPSMSGMWTGRVAFVHRDARGRLKFLFDLIPLTGWPPANEEVGGATTAGRNAPLRGVVRVRLRQPFVGNLRNLTTTPTGIIVVPEIGSVVSVEMDEAGWIITGFHSGPIVASDQSVAALNEFSYNPGFEEALPALSSDSRIPWLFGIDEGDIILGRGDSRIKLRGEGVFIGSGVQCLHLYKTDSGEMFERYVEMQRRGSGRLSYHRHMLGVNATAQKTSTIALPATDALVINTDIIESSPYYRSNKPYVIAQRGHVTKSTVDLGRLAGEILPMPGEITSETALGTFAIMRDTVVAPKVEPTGSNADSTELQTTSSVMFDHQVGADGSFHVRAGNAARTPGASQLHESSQLNFEMAFDATTQVFSLAVMQGGQPIVGFKFGGLTGEASIEAANVLRLKAKQVIIESDVMTQITSKGTLEVTSQNAQITAAGVLTMIQEVVAGIIALTKHQHTYVAPAIPAGPAPTTPPIA